MKRWNGWGNPNTEVDVTRAGLAFLTARIGPVKRPRDAALADVVATVPACRLPDHPLVIALPETRVRHARGQSFPDWVALRGGRIPVFPDGVAFPQSDEEVQTLLGLAREQGWRLIPYGGGSSVTGHINPEAGERPVLTVNLTRLNRLRALDEISQLATFGAGVAGPDLEAQLRTHGLTLGHYPQSFEYSTLGGWVATRSSGQQSRGYGRIEDLFAGGTVLTPAGPLHLPPLPASAAGPDLRQVVLGSEGRLGILTEAVVRVSPLPEEESFQALFFPTFAAGAAAVREMLQAGAPLSMVRLSTAPETETTLRLAGHERLIGALEGLLRLRGVGGEKALLLLGFTGRPEPVAAGRKMALELARARGGVHVGRQLGDQWAKNRFRTPYLRNTLWAFGIGIDTVETAVPWAQVEATRLAVEAAIHEAAEAFGERLHAFSHLSHVYPSGASIYTTLIFRLATDPEESLTRWARLKAAASEAIVAHGGTISHQHGVGKDHRPYLVAEKGELGMALLADAARRFDPAGILDNGNLV